MASTKHRANHNPRASLPKRFRPFYDQARVESALRYGAQQRGLGSLLEQLGHDYGIQAQAQKDAGQSLLGALQGADQQLTQTYSQAGLTPEVLAGIGNSPTGQRLAAELASNRANIQQQQLGAQAGQQYIQQHLADQYQQDVGKVRDQLIGLLGERGLFESQTLADLIGQDRSARHEANVALREQRHDDRQKLLDRQAQRERAFIGQGLLPGKDGELTPLPGGKADKRSKRPKASPKTIQNATGTFNSILTYVRAMHEKGIGRHTVGQALTLGRKAQKGEKVYDPATGRPAIWQPGEKGNEDGSKTGTQKTTGAKNEVPSFKGDLPLLKAALDMIYDGHISPNTVKMLRKAYGTGIVKSLPGVTTNRRAPRPRLPRSNPQGVFANPISPPRIR